MEDQRAFNQMVMTEFYPTVAAPEHARDGAVVLAASRTLRLMPLPAAGSAAATPSSSGSRWSRRSASTSTSPSPRGRRARQAVAALREAALWNLEPSGHFAGERYLSFTPPAIPTPYPPARVEPLADCRRRTARGEPPPSQYAGWWNADRLAADAAAAGGGCVSEVRQYKDKNGDDGIHIDEALRTSPRLQRPHEDGGALPARAPRRDGGRVAPQPHLRLAFGALCDRSEWPDIMPTCRLENSDLAFPFRSPLNFLINVHFMQGIEGGDGTRRGVPYRPARLPREPPPRRRCATRYRRALRRRRRWRRRAAAAGAGGADRAAAGGMRCCRAARPTARCCASSGRGRATTARRCSTWRTRRTCSAA